jgi:hypothetical protein
MKNIIVICIIATGLSSAVLGQAKSSNSDKVRSQIISLEKAGWEAWKNKDASWTTNNTTEEFLLVNSYGVSNRAEVIKSTTTDCEVKSYSLTDFQFVMVDRDSALMTYIAMQNGICSGETIPAKVRASVVYVKRGAKWLEALYMETPAK